MLPALADLTLLKPSQKTKYSRFNKLFEETPQYPYLQRLLLKKWKINFDEPVLGSNPIFQQPEPTADYDYENWDIISKTTVIEDSDDLALIEQAYLGIRKMGKEQIDFIEKEIGYVSFEDADKLNTILDVRPVTSMHIKDRNEKKPAHKQYDPKKYYVLVINIKGKPRTLRQLSDTEGKVLYKVTRDEDGQEIYTVNLAKLILESKLKRAARYKAVLDEPRPSRFRKNQQEENERREAQKRERIMASISNSEDKEDEEHSVVSKKICVEQDQLPSLYNRLEKKVNNLVGEMERLKNENIILKNENIMLKRDVSFLKQESREMSNRIEEYQEVMETDANLKKGLKRIEKRREVNQELDQLNSLKKDQLNSLKKDLYNNMYVSEISSSKNSQQGQRSNFKGVLKSADCNRGEVLSQSPSKNVAFKVEQGLINK